MATPHNSWASVYDLAYEQTHSNYTSLLNVTLEAIQESVEPPASIVDFGAGTGRLSVPLAGLGFNVVAVEPSVNMLAQLQRKCKTAEVETVNCKIQDFQSDRRFDFALCVFTVVIYLLDTESLVNSARAIASSLKPGTLLLIDVPKRSIFRSYKSRTPRVLRAVTVSQVDESDFYDYSETLTVKSTGKSTVYTDEFQVRYWDYSELVAVFEQNNLLIQQDLTDRFSGSGCKYLLMKKAG